MTAPRCLIVSSRAWDPELPARVAAKSGAVAQAICQRDELTVEAIAAFGPDWIFITHWSWKIPASIYSRWRCVLFHMTDLPFGRGGSPLQNLIACGFTETKVSAFRCTEGLDEGPVYLKEPLSLDGTAQEIYQRASAVIERMILSILTDAPESRPQVGNPVIFERRRPEEGSIARLDDLDRVYDWIRMLDADGYPPAFVDIGSLRLEFRCAKRSGDHVAANVTIRRKP